MLDTETTALRNAEIVDIAITSSRGEPLLNSLCRPQKDISPEASAIHHIYAADVVDAPTFPELYPQIADAIESAELVLIYNADFDTRVLRDVCSLHSLPPFKIEAVDCVMRAYSMWAGNWSEKRKSYTWQKLDGGNHRALGDCIATINTIRKMAGLPAMK
jgi:DNA polymerase-3 subunit epsilon